MSNIITAAFDHARRSSTRLLFQDKLHNCWILFLIFVLSIVELTATSEPSTNGTVQLELFPNPGQLDSYPVDMFSLLDTFRNSDGIIKLN